LSAFFGVFYETIVAFKSAFEHTTLWENCLIFCMFLWIEGPWSYGS